MSHVIDDIGEEIFALAAKIYPDLPEHHGRRRPGDTPRDRRAYSAGHPRSADRHAGLRLDGAARMEHPRRLHQERQRREDRRFRQVEPACHELQRAGARAHVARRTQAAHLHLAGSTGPDPLPDVLLRGELGVLHAASAIREPARRELRGRHRFKPDGRPPHLRRVSAQGRDRGRVPAVRPRLPSFACQRQLLRHRASDPSGKAAVRPANALQLSLPVRAGHDRRHHLARPQRAACIPDQARPGALHGRRRRRPHLQEEPAWRCGDRPRHGPRAAPLRTVADDSGLLAVRLRRAPVLLARLQPAGRAVSAQQIRRNSRSITPRPTTSISSARSTWALLIA